LVKLHAFVDYIESVRAGVVQKRFKAPGYIAPYVAFNKDSKKLCFDPIRFYDEASALTITKTKKYLYSAWTVAEAKADFPTDCPADDFVVKMSLRDFAEHLAMV
jgi:hypothetical protein